MFMFEVVSCVLISLAVAEKSESTCEIMPRKGYNVVMYRYTCCVAYISYDVAVIYLKWYYDTD